MKNFILLNTIATATIISCALASPVVTCPTVNQIKNGEFAEWLPLYRDNEELASDQDVALFRKNITDFEIARWDREYLENGHCFYQGKHPILNRIILAQDAYQPENKPQWVWVSKNLAECVGNPSECGFVK